MKKIIIGAILALALYGFFAGFSGCGMDYASREQLENVRTELRDSISVVSEKTDRNYWKIDSLELRLAEIEAEIECLKRNQDTLKKGQLIIYSAIRSREARPSEYIDAFFSRMRELFSSQKSY